MLKTMVYFGFVFSFAWKCFQATMVDMKTQLSYILEAVKTELSSSFKAGRVSR